MAGAEWGGWVVAAYWRMRKFPLYYATWAHFEHTFSTLSEDY